MCILQIFLNLSINITHIGNTPANVLALNNFALINIEFTTIFTPMPMVTIIRQGTGVGLTGSNYVNLIYGLSLMMFIYSAYFWNLNIYAGIPFVSVGGGFFFIAYIADSCNRRVRSGRGFLDFYSCCCGNKAEIHHQGAITGTIH